MSFILLLLLLPLLLVSCNFFISAEPYIFYAEDDCKATKWHLNTLGDTYGCKAVADVSTQGSGLQWDELTKPDRIQDCWSGLYRAEAAGNAFIQQHYKRVAGYFNTKTFQNVPEVPWAMNSLIIQQAQTGGYVGSGQQLFARMKIWFRSDPLPCSGASCALPAQFQKAYDVSFANLGAPDWEHLWTPEQYGQIALSPFRISSGTRTDPYVVIQIVRWCSEVSLSSLYAVNDDRGGIAVDGGLPPKFPPGATNNAIFISDPSSEAGRPSEITFHTPSSCDVASFSLQTTIKRGTCASMYDVVPETVGDLGSAFPSGHDASFATEHARGTSSAPKYSQPTLVAFTLSTTSSFVYFDALAIQVPLGKDDIISSIRVWASTSPWTERPSDESSIFFHAMDSDEIADPGKLRRYNLNGLYRAKHVLLEIGYGCLFPGLSSFVVFASERYTGEPQQTTTSTTTTSSSTTFTSTTTSSTTTESSTSTTIVANPPPPPPPPTTEDPGSPSQAPSSSPSSSASPPPPAPTAVPPPTAVPATPTSTTDAGASAPPPSFVPTSATTSMVSTASTSTTTTTTTTTTPVGSNHSNEDNSNSSVNVQVKEATNAMQGLNMVLSAVSGATSVAMGFSISRQQAMVQLTQKAQTGSCAGWDSNGTLAAADSPTQLALGSGQGRYVAGAALGNVILTLCLMLLAQALGHGYLFLTGSSNYANAWHVAARCQVAMVLFVCLSLLLLPSLSTAFLTVTVKNNQSSSSSSNQKNSSTEPAADDNTNIGSGEQAAAMTSAMLLLVVTVFYTIWALFVRRRFETYVLVPKLTKEEEAKRSKIIKFMSFWFEGPGNWEMTVHKNNSNSNSKKNCRGGGGGEKGSGINKGKKQRQLNPPTVDDHLKWDLAMPQLDGWNDRAFWFSCMEFGSQIGLAIATLAANLVEEKVSCVTLAVIQAVVLSLYLIVIMMRRPFQELFLRIATPLMVAAQIVVVVMVAAFTASSGMPSWINALVLFIVSMQSVMGILTVVSSFSPLFKWAMRAYRRWQRHRSKGSSSSRRNEKLPVNLKQLLREDIDAEEEAEKKKEEPKRRSGADGGNKNKFRDGDEDGEDEIELRLLASPSAAASPTSSSTAAKQKPKRERTQLTPELLQKLEQSRAIKTAAAADMKSVVQPPRRKETEPKKQEQQQPEANPTIATTWNNNRARKAKSIALEEI